MTDGDSSAALARLRQAKAAIGSNLEVKRVVDARDEVLARFGPLLQPDTVGDLTDEAIRPFFYMENNKHWSGLYRQVNRICGDMDAFRGVLTTLVDESQPIDVRLDQVAGQVKGLGKAILTALLLIAYPDRYGVWNNTSDGSLIQLGLMPEFAHGASFGTRYAQINEILNRLAEALEVDLWTLDALWWMVQMDEGDASDAEVPIDVQMVSEAEAQFALERHLQYFLFDNWDATLVGKDWKTYTRPGEPEAGFEFNCGVGRIDILAHHRSEPRWLVVELKRGKSSDTVVAQTLRYMSWIKKHHAQPGETVEGLIIALDADPKLHYAIDMVPGLSFMSYRVEFQLVEAPSPEAWIRP